MNKKFNVVFFAGVLTLLNAVFLLPGGKERSRFDERPLPAVTTIAGESPDGLEGFSADGMIDNEFWEIKTGRLNAANSVINAEKLQAAIDAAAEKGLAEIKLEKASYYVEGGGEKEVINLPSDMNLNLNGAAIVHAANSKPTYFLLSLYRVKNVKIFNGTLAGDRMVHDYVQDADEAIETHEWGMGVRIAEDCENVGIFDLKIYDFTGDGVYINGAPASNNPRWAKNITIRNNDIFNCRRQGISIVGYTDGVEIYDNYIHDIGTVGGSQPTDPTSNDFKRGTNPMSCIDIESNYNYPTYDAGNNRNIMIRNNILDNKKAMNFANEAYRVVLRDNIITGAVNTSLGDEILIENNFIEHVAGPTQQGGLGYYWASARDLPQRIIIRNNTLVNVHVNIQDQSRTDPTKTEQRDGYVAVVGNKMINSSIRFHHLNCLVTDNAFEFFSTNPNNYIWLQFSMNDSARETYHIYNYGNSVTGHYIGSNELRYSENEKLVVHTSKTEAQAFYGEMLEYFKWTETPDAPDGLTGTINAPLSSIALLAGWTWTDPAETMTAAGEQTFLANYTYIDTVGVYKNAVGVPLTVTVQKLPTPAAPGSLSGVINDRLIGVALPAGWEWAEPAEQMISAGGHTFLANYTDANGVYENATGISLAVTVRKLSTPAAPDGLTGTVNGELSGVTLPAGWAWANPDETMPETGEHTFLANYTDANGVYENAAGISLTVTVQNASTNNGGAAGGLESGGGEDGGLPLDAYILIGIGAVILLLIILILCIVAKKGKAKN